MKHMTGTFLKYRDLWFTSAASNEALDSRSLTLPLSPQQDGEEKWTKGKTCGLR